MTKKEAIQQMKLGKKITHRHFTPDEWMTMQGTVIILEDGVKCDEEQFWPYRTGSSWDDGYEFFKT